MDLCMLVPRLVGSLASAHRHLGWHSPRLAYIMREAERQCARRLIACFRLEYCIRSNYSAINAKRPPSE